MGRKYSIAEIDQMRRFIEWSYPSGVSYNSEERAADVEDQLRTYMQNGTEPEELEAMAMERINADMERQENEQKWREEQMAKAPPPRILSTADDVIDEWFQTSVAQYDGASATVDDLYDGFSGRTLKRFANRHAPDGVHIRKKDMERYLDKKGIRSRNAMFKKRYDGVQVVAYGDVRSGNFGT